MDSSTPSNALKLLTDGMYMVAQTLYYVADPMCSWCWGFAPTLELVASRLLHETQLQLVLGGLAADSDEPMDEATKTYLQQAWRSVSEATGATFNFAFWEQCAPRRSTWPACRAVLAAGELGRQMFAAIQRAYYLEARNPSDTSTLIELAAELGIDIPTFTERLASNTTHKLLTEHFELRDRLAAQGFPTLLLERDGEVVPIARGFARFEALEATLRKHNAIL
tara:strand:+ start:2192 stop:2860 length:669 start_codon:yes stop_codon:yes gene_type:complete